MRQHYEHEFSSRVLHQLEGFWRLDNQYMHGEAVIFKTDPTTNRGFAFAQRTIECEWHYVLPYNPPDDRIVGRWKPSAQSGVYAGQLLMDDGHGSMFWTDATLTLLDSTTAELAIHVTGPVLGGSVQRMHFAGPASEMEARIKTFSNSSRPPSSNTSAVYGSGFLVAPGLVVTNHHVTDGATRISCHHKDGVSAAHSIAHDAKNDIALLLCDHPIGDNADVFSIGDSSSVRLGQRVFAFGYPLTQLLGTDLRVHQGIISSLSGYAGAATEFQVQMGLNYGDSGGPLVTESGSVVGIVSSKLSVGNSHGNVQVPEDISFAVKSEVLRALLKSAQMLEQIRLESADRTGAFSLEQITQQLGPAVVRIEARFEGNE
ncbi:MAG: serine protease [Phycisphaerae bacterium]|nr:serine protease [Phycisphaerae bacterium]